MSRPLPRAVLLFAAALALGLRAPPVPPAPLLLPAVGIFLLLIVRASFSVRALICVAGAGLVLGVVAGASARADCRHALPDGARLEARGWLAAQPGPDGAATLRLDAVRVGSRDGDCVGVVRARGDPAEWTGVPGGAGIVVRGRWLAFPARGAWPRRGEWAGVLIVDSLDVARPASLVERPAAVLRARAQRQVRASFGERAGLVEALLLARGDGIDPELRERFARAGLSHLLAISGLHVGVVAGVLLLIGRAARLSPRVTALAAVVATAGYVALLGAPHAAARAALQLGLITAARLRQRPADPFSLLAAAAFALLLFDPLAILDAGFQLSFAGVIGLLALRRRLLGLLPGGRLRWLADGIATSVAATAATAPIAALHFSRIAPIGVLANLAAIPLVGLAVPALALAIAAGSVWPAAGRFLAGGGELILAALDRVAAAAAAVPGGSVWVPADAPLAWAAAALAAACATAWLTGSAARPHGRGGRRGIRPGVRRAAASAVAAAVLLAWPVAVRRGGDGLEVHVIDVGQGDAIAIRSPTGRWILVDAGPRTAGFDAGRARVVPFLLRHGVRRLEALVLTHPDTDHIGGAPAVLDALDVAAIVDPGLAAGRRPFLDLVDRARRSGARWIAARAGRAVRVDGITLRFLHPEATSLDGTAGANQVSVAFRLDYGEFGALFLGDLPAEIEERIAARPEMTEPIDLLKVAHHGSATSTGAALLDAARPRFAAISVGRHNRYGHPHPAVLARLGSRGVHVFRTDRDGTIRIRAGSDGRIEVEATR